MHFIRTNFLKDPLARTIGQKLRDIIKKVSVCLEFRMELISTILVSMVIDLLTILWINSQFFFFEWLFGLSTVQGKSSNAITWLEELQWIELYKQRVLICNNRAMTD